VADDEVGAFLVPAMTAHRNRVAVGWAAGSRLDGSGPTPLDFRTHALLLLGELRTTTGLLVLRAVPGVA
jgi:hypothetical protein